LYLTLYIQDDLGYGPLAAGIRFLPITVMAFVVAPVAGKLTVRMQSRYLLGVGLLLVTGGLLLMATTHPDSGWTQLLPGYIVAGAGIGMVNPVLASASIAVVPFQRAGMASGANSTFRQVGIATGIAGLGAVFASQIQHKTQAALRATPVGHQVAAHGGTALNQALQAGAVRQAAQAIGYGPARSALLSAYRVAFSGTLNELLVIGAVVAFVGSVGAFALVRQEDFVPSFAGGGPAGGGSGPGTDGAGTGGDAGGPAPADSAPAVA